MMKMQRSELFMKCAALPERILDFTLLCRNRPNISASCHEHESVQQYSIVHVGLQRCSMEQSSSGVSCLHFFAMMKREFPGPMLFGNIVYERHVSERRCWNAKTIYPSCGLRYFHLRYECSLVVSISMSLHISYPQSL